MCSPYLYIITLQPRQILSPVFNSASICTSILAGIITGSEPALLKEIFKYIEADL